MWERFTKHAKQVVSTARDESRRLGSEYVRPEHLVLGICDAPEGIAARALENLGMEIQVLATGIRQRIRPGSAVFSDDDIPFSSRSKRVLEHAVMHARDFHHSYIGTEHILLGLLNEAEGIAAVTLRDFAINLDTVKVEIIRQLGEQGGSCAQ